ncbi:TPA: IS3 family transposase [Bacillus cereus]|nr:IS3 family transposase [Bacillus cereus]
MILQIREIITYYNHKRIEKKLKTISPGQYRAYGQSAT